MTSLANSNLRIFFYLMLKLKIRRKNSDAKKERKKPLLLIFNFKAFFCLIVRPLCYKSSLFGASLQGSVCTDLKPSSGCNQAVIMQTVHLYPFMLFLYTYGHHRVNNMVCTMYILSGLKMYCLRQAVLERI